MRAYVNTTATVRDDLGTLDAVPTVSIPGSALKAGMVLVDPDFDTPAGEVDHRMKTTRGSGEVKFLMFDFDAREWTTQSVHHNAMIKVMARA